MMISEIMGGRKMDNGKKDVCDCDGLSKGDSMKASKERGMPAASVLTRFTTGLAGTPGILHCVNGAILYTLELPWRENKRRASCIPAGLYEYNFLPQTSSRKYKNVFYLQDVANRTGILMHNGNYLSHTKGCILIGTQTGIVDTEHAVWSSRKGMEKLRSPSGFGLVTGSLLIKNSWESG